MTRDRPGIGPWERELEAITGGTLTKAALVELVADVAELMKKRAEVIVETVFSSIAESLRRGEKELKGQINREPAETVLRPTSR